MMKHGKLALFATLLVPGTAFAQINVGDELGASETAIRTALQAQGYTATEIEIENGEIELEAQTGGELFEIEISAETGMVLAVYREFDDDGEDEDEDDDDNDSDDDDDDEDDD